MKLEVSESFRSRADMAAFWEAWVGAVMTRAGFQATMMPWDIDSKDHSESWDLELVIGCAYWKVEVKSINLSFTGVKDYPKEPVLVCSQNNFLKKSSDGTVPRPFFLVSRLTGNIVVVPEGAVVGMNHEVLDRTRNELYKCVTVRKDQLIDLQDWIDEAKEISGC